MSTDCEPRSAAFQAMNEMERIINYFNFRFTDTKIVELISCGFSRHGETTIFIHYMQIMPTYANGNPYKKPTAAAPPEGS
jgi:hypothetical protein